MFGKLYERAAMEPGLRDRENAEFAAELARLRSAAMEPGLRDRENLSADGISPPSGMPRRGPAWETGKTDRVGRRLTLRPSRNGARPERPGKPEGAGNGTAEGAGRNGARPERPGKLGNPIDWANLP